MDGYIKINYSILDDVVRQNELCKQSMKEALNSFNSIGEITRENLGLTATKMEETEEKLYASIIKG